MAQKQETTLAKTKETSAKPRKKSRTVGFSEVTRKNRLNAEIKRLSALENLFDEDHKLIAGCLINDIAFMTVTMDEAKSIIAASGIIEEYQNGENQKGYKKSSAVETYDKMANSRLRCIKQLCDMLPVYEPIPGATQSDPADAVRSFIAQTSE